MKSIIKSFVFISLVSVSSSYAWNFPRNPDYAPSIGFHVTNYNVEGSRTEIDMPSGHADRSFYGLEDRSKDTYGTDLRLPIHSGITVNFFYDKINMAENFSREGNVYQEKTLLKGYEMGFGIRCYFSQ